MAGKEKYTAVQLLITGVVFVAILRGSFAELLSAEDCTINLVAQCTTPYNRNNDPCQYRDCVADLLTKCSQHEYVRLEMNQVWNTMERKCFEATGLTSARTTTVPTTTSTTRSTSTVSTTVTSSTTVGDVNGATSVTSLAFFPCILLACLSTILT
ncbi:uncharacterized protein LOC106164304 [Lingula anatina]|uniref:Uncharacterized protein LOC106164304 n=1 Tax=Lingula anatina TaxID=7574 RepID=A0A1S3IJG0_LINAN|nr:uncharacterized protein LOC106164304 [Lingula anatina]|eukprot:XP_013397639.1 uncharacterized protein LOC106164304 [Lingula anatina]